MGLFNDNVNANRTTWNYFYAGFELLEAATRMYNEFLNKEHDARQRMAGFMQA
jgi:hypothetical protein